jgi:redox-sensing transcriptional repressor
VGKLGSALIEYPGLPEYGLKLVAVFDNDSRKTGKAIGSFSILPMESLSRVVQSFDVGIAIITVPKESAQEVCDLVVAQNIKAIWNFAPTQLRVPAEVTIRHENMAVGLALLSHYLKKRKAESVVID